MAFGRGKKKRNDGRNGSSSKRNGSDTGTRRSRHGRSDVVIPERLQHPTFDPSAARKAADETWEEKERERSGRDITKRFRYIIIFCVAILVVIALTAITANIASSNNGTQSVSAEATYAISSNERSEMETTARNFATALVSSTYLKDEDTANNMRTMALSYMASGTQAYTDVQALPVAKGDLTQDDIYVNITKLKMDDGSKAYSGTYTYTLTAQAANKKDKTYVDGGYQMKLYFSKAEGDNGTKWVISNLEIYEAS